MNLLIDGYNLIFQCGLQGRRTDSLALEAARQRLISELTARLDDESRNRTTIVFDAADRPIKNVPDEQSINAMRVIFAVHHDEADSLIEELIRSHSNPKNLLVVSSDHRIHKSALRRKATPIDSDVWFERLERERHDAGMDRVKGRTGFGDSSEKQLPPGLENIDWEKEFGLSDDSEEPNCETPKSTHPNPFPPGYGEDLLE